MANNCKQCFNEHYQPHGHPTTNSLWLCSSVHCGPPHQSRRIWLSAVPLAVASIMAVTSHLDLFRLVNEIITKFCPTQITAASQKTPSNTLPRTVSNRMMSLYAADWMRHISRYENNKLRTYSTIKDAFALEPYLTQSPLSIRRDITRLRISCHPLAIETGRYSQPKIPVEYRLCELCNMNCVEDEYHMLLVCPFYSNERALMFDEINQHTQLSNIPSPSTFKTILSLGAANSVLIPHVGSFISTCFEKRKGVEIRK